MVNQRLLVSANTRLHVCDVTTLQHHNIMLTLAGAAPGYGFYLIDCPENVVLKCSG